MNKFLSHYRKTPVIKVIGVGGGGSNAVIKMLRAPSDKVEYIIANTDAQAMEAVEVPKKLLLGYSVTRGMGSGGDPMTGEKAAVESIGEIKRALENADMVFVTAGMGGGTGTGAAPIVASIAKEVGALTVSVVTKPFDFEGPERMNNANSGISALRPCVDSLITIDNNNLLKVSGGLKLDQAFAEVDDVLRQGIRAVIELVTLPSLVNLDFADVKKVMQNRGNALLGIGHGEGPNKAVEAGNGAVTSPFLDGNRRLATEAIVSVVGGDDMTLNDAHEAVQEIRSVLGSTVNLIFGVGIGKGLEDKMRVSLIATGLLDEPSSATK